MIFYKRYKDYKTERLEIYCQFISTASYMYYYVSCIITDSSVIHPKEYYKSRFKVLTFEEDLRKAEFVENSRISKWVF